MCLTIFCSILGINFLKSFFEATHQDQDISFFLNHFFFWQVYGGQMTTFWELVLSFNLVGSREEIQAIR